MILVRVPPRNKAAVAQSQRCKGGRKAVKDELEGQIKWGMVQGKQVKCKKIRMLLLEKRGRNALNRLRSKRYRGTFVVVYTAQVSGVKIKNTVKLTSK